MKIFTLLMRDASPSSLVLLPVRFLLKSIYPLYTNVLLAGKLHTGRSRNDQVATDMRIWLLEQVETLESLMKDLLKVTIARAESEIDHIMPGYTHLQVRRIRLYW